MTPVKPSQTPEYHQMTLTDRSKMWEEYRKSAFDIGVWQLMQDGISMEAATQIQKHFNQIEAKAYFRK